RFSSPDVYAWGNNKENRRLSPINGAFNPCYLLSPGVNTWARERSSFKLRDYRRGGKFRFSFMARYLMVRDTGPARLLTLEPSFNVSFCGRDRTIGWNLRS